MLGFVISQAQEQQSKQHFLLFWRSDCTGCHTAIPQLVKKAAQLDTSLFSITTISFDTDSVSYFTAIKTLRMMEFTNLYNFKKGYAGSELAKKYSVTKTPMLLYIDNQGNVLAEGSDAFKKLCTFKKE
jgi:thioredoxin-related protein